MKAIRQILAGLRKADETFNLINNNDRIAIGVSGGKDSMVMLYALRQYQKFAHINFTIIGVFLDLGFPNSCHEQLKEYAKSLDLDLTIYDCKDVYQILKANKGNNQKLPCSICSRMKKAAINKFAKENNCNKVAFAHHVDDALETLFMNEIFNAKIATFSPKMYLERANITFIRPFVLLKEDTILTCAEELRIPSFNSGCPNDKKTKREDVKKLVAYIKKEYPQCNDNLYTMLTNFDKVDLWDKEVCIKINNVLTLKSCMDNLEVVNTTFIHQKYNNKFIPNDLIALLENNHLFNIYENDTLIGTISLNISNNISTFSHIYFLDEKYFDSVLNIIIKYFENRIIQTYKDLTFKIVSNIDISKYIKKLDYNMQQSNSLPFIFIKN